MVECEDGEEVRWGKREAEGEEEEEEREREGASRGESPPRLT